MQPWQKQKSSEFMEYKRWVLLLRPTDVLSNLPFANPQGSPDYFQGIHKTCKR